MAEVRYLAGFDVVNLDFIISFLNDAAAVGDDCAAVLPFCHLVRSFHLGPHKLVA